MNPFKTAFAPGNRLPAAVILALVAILPFYVWHDNTSGFLTDDGMHLMLADFFSPWYDRNYLVEHFVATRSRFPPFFPVLIAIAGGGSQNMPVAHLVTAACFVFSALLFFIWARGVLPMRHAALGCLLVYVLLPESLLYVLELRSEFLYMGLVFAAFLLLEKQPETRQRQREILIAASFVVALAFLTRTVGVVLFGAFLIHLLLNRVRSTPLYLAVFCVLPAAWLLIKEINGYSGNYVEDIRGYLDPGGLYQLVTSEIPRNISLVFEGWKRHLAVRSGSPWPYTALAAALLALGVLGAAARARRRAVDFFYLALYLPPILIWPHPFHIQRLVYPLVPILLVYVVIGTGVALRGVSDRARALAPALVIGIMLAMIAPNVLSVTGRMIASVPDHLPDDFRHTRIWLRTPDLERAYPQLEATTSVIRLLRRAGEHVPEDQCMYAVHPVTAMLYSNRLAVLVPEEPSIKYFTLCRYLFVMNLVGLFEPRYPLGGIEQQYLDPIDVEYGNRETPQAYLFRIKR